MSTRLDFVRQASWFPSRPRPSNRARAACGPLAANGFLPELLSDADRDKLREINVSLTRLAFEQCAVDAGARNQIDLGTQICLALADFEVRGVSREKLLALAAEHDVVFPWSLQYGNVRTPFNRRLVRLPLAIAFPRTVDEVVRWVNFVREHDLTVSVRSGNNSYEGLSSTNDVVIDVSFLTLEPGLQYEIDAEQQVVHVSPGVRLGVLYTELGNANLALSGGQCAPVCIGGLVGTGGIGFASRTFGFTCDGLIEVEAVLADGTVVVANATNEYADLYRACKGAGAAGIGVMTRLTMKIEPAVPLLWHAVVFDAQMVAAEGTKILARWQNLVDAPRAFSCAMSFNASSDGESTTLVAFGEYRVENGEDVSSAEAKVRDIFDRLWLGELTSKPLVIVQSFPLDEGETLGQGTIDAATVGALLAPMPTFSKWKLKSKFTVRPWTEEELAPLIDFMLHHAPAPEPTDAIGVFNPIVLGGATNAIDPESAVLPIREDGVAWVHTGALWNDESVAESSLAWVKELWAILDKICSPTSFYNCPELELGSQLTDPPTLDYVRAYWSSASHDFVPFLIAVKNKYDPFDVFWGAQSIPLSLEPDSL